MKNQLTNLQSLVSATPEQKATLDLGSIIDNATNSYSLIKGIRDKNAQKKKEEETLNSLKANFLEENQNLSDAQKQAINGISSLNEFKDLQNSFYNRKDKATALDYQKQRDSIADDRYNQNFDYQKSRDSIGDDRYNQSLDYQKQRDTIADKRYNQNFDYQKSRDVVADENNNLRLQLQQQQLEKKQDLENTKKAQENDANNKKLQVSIERGREIANIFNDLPDDYFGGGTLNSLSRWSGEVLGSENSQKAKALQSNATQLMIQGLKATFGGAISDGERSALQGILNDFSVPKDALYSNLKMEVSKMLADRNLEPSLVDQILPPLKTEEQKTQELANTRQYID